MVYLSVNLTTNQDKIDKIEIFDTQVQRPYFIPTSHIKTPQETP